MYHEICYRDEYRKPIMVLSPYDDDDNYRVARDALSVRCFDPYDYNVWNTIPWMEERIKWIVDNNIKMAGLDHQQYVLCADCEEYFPLDRPQAKSKWLLEFRFINKSDAIWFKTVWG